MTVQELIDELQKVEDKGLPLLVTVDATLDDTYLYTKTETYVINEQDNIPDRMPAGFYVEISLVDKRELRLHRVAKATKVA